jgi:hypothetical protein
MKRLLMLCVIASFLSGCIYHAWLQTEAGRYALPDQNISAELPDGWMRLNTDDYLLITRDGQVLQYIMVQKTPCGKELKYTKKKIRPDMLPNEAAEIIIDNYKMNPSVLNMKVETNKPAKIDGRSGFELIFNYKDSNGLTFKSMFYGFLDGKCFYGIRYNAPQRYYYHKDIKTFEKFLGGLKVGA